MSELKNTMNRHDLNKAINKIFRAVEVPGDTRDEEGFLVCSVCGKRKEKEHDIDGKTYRWMADCDCMKAKKEALEAEERMRREQELRLDLIHASGLSDVGRRHTFESMTGPEPAYVGTVKRFVEEFDVMESQNVGMMILGNVGTGKTFLAECVANALLENLVSVRFLSLPMYLQLSKEEMQKERAKALHSRLLILDDLGAERDSDFAVEAVYDLIERRRGQGKPIFITSNLEKSQLRQADLQHKRVYDRVLELCPAIVSIDGVSRRAAEGAARLAIAKALIDEAEKVN